MEWFDTRLQYIISGLSVSLTTGYEQFATFAETLIDRDYFFTQSVSNASKTGNALGDILKNVVTVGAYNVDQMTTGWAQTLQTLMKSIYMPIVA